MKPFKELRNRGDEVATEAGAGLHVEIRVCVPHKLVAGASGPSFKLHMEASRREQPFGEHGFSHDGDGGRGCGNRRCLDFGASADGVSGAAAADLVCAAASFNALATAGDSGVTGATTGGCAVAGTGCIPFGVKLTSLVLPSIVTEESVAVAMSMRAFRHGMLLGYGTCACRSSVP